MFFIASLKNLAGSRTKSSRKKLQGAESCYSAFIQQKKSRRVAKKESGFMTIVMIVMLLIVILLLAYIGYQLFLRLELDGLRGDSPKMRRKISIYKNRQNSRHISVLLIVLIVVGILIIGLIYNQYVLRNEIKELEAKIENVDVTDGNSAMAVEEYKQDSLKLTEFPWDKVLTAADSASLTKYEIQLANEWKPYFGDLNITIIKSDATGTMTISAAAASLSNDGYKIARQNAEKFVKELNAVEQVTMIDFNFTYRNESNNLTKDYQVYSKTYKVEDFEKIEAE